MCACVLVCSCACVLMCVCVCVLACARACVRACVEPSRYARAEQGSTTTASARGSFFYSRRPGPPVMENRSFNEKKERKGGEKEKRKHPIYPSLKGRLKNRIKSHVRLWRRRTARPVIRCGKLDAFPLFLFSFPSFFFLAGP